jgi:hypothetical protein
MEKWRYSVTLLILIAMVGGIWTRHVYTGSNLAGSLVEIRQPSKASGIDVTGTFEEPVGRLKGFEVALPNCRQPMAILPISTKTYAGSTAAEYRYHPGEYKIVYVLNSHIYPEDWITYRLTFLRIFYRFQSMFGLIKGRQFAYYLKIWVPSGCADVLPQDVSALERAIIVDVF